MAVVTSSVSTDCLDRLLLPAIVTKAAEIFVKNDEGVGEAVPNIGQGLVGYIDQRGVGSSTRMTSGTTGVYEGLPAVTRRRKGGLKTGYINLKGEVVINPRFEHAHEFIDGAAEVCEVWDQDSPERPGAVT
jgi:hypothetical protein